MDGVHAHELIDRASVLARLAAGEPVEWANPARKPMDEVRCGQELGAADIDDARARLERFAPLVAELFPQTRERGGIIESELVEIPAMRAVLNERHGAGLSGRLLLKKDSHLAVAGSVKARGGIYEVLKFAEDLALEEGLLVSRDSGEGAFRSLAGEHARKVFAGYSIRVGSTGNLGLSIGIMGAALGFHVEVFMSREACQWKKDLLRSYGAVVVESEGDYGAAVARAREEAAVDPTCHFVDDENSRDLFLGYAVAASRLRPQLDELGVEVGEENPLFVYIPCGVGGAPGGISFGLRHEFGDAVHCFFVEPTSAPCMLAGMASGLHGGICVQDLGLDGRTQADGLAVGRASGLVGPLMCPHFSGGLTVDDALLFDYLRDLDGSERVFVEPSACAAFRGPARIERSPELRAYLEAWGLAGRMGDATHIVWATGGSLVPEEERATYLAWQGRGLSQPRP